MIKEELSEENNVITFCPSSLSKLSDMEISLMRNQIFPQSILQTSYYLLSILNPGASKARNQRPKILGSWKQTSPILAILIFEQKLPTLYISQIISKVKFHFSMWDVISLLSSCWEAHISPAPCQMQADTIPEPTDPGDAFPAKFFRNTFPMTSGPPPALMLLTTPTAHLDLVFNPPVPLHSLQSHPELFWFFSSPIIPSNLQAGQI